MIDYVYLNDEHFSVDCQLQRLRALEPHYHEDRVVLLYVLKGKLNLHAGGLHRVVNEGELAFVGPGEVHYTEDESDNEILVSHVKISDQYYCKSMVYGEYEQEGLKMQLLSLTYFYYMEELIEEGVYEYACEKIVKKVDELLGVPNKQICNYIQNNYPKDLKVGNVGEYFGLSNKSVTYCLQKEGLGSFSEYITYIRCKEADKLILESNMQVKRIAGITGFSSVRSFIRDYTAYTGRTPLQQRKYYKERKKHKFNRVTAFNSYHITNVMPHYLGEVHMKKILGDLRDCC